MRKHFDEQLKDLKEQLLKMGAIVEEEIEIAIKALMTQDSDLVDKVFELEGKTDELEIIIEDKCLDLLALQQPIAKDLRMVSTILKIITDLERIGDHGVNIAKVTKKIGNEKFIKPLVDIPKMADIAKKMIKESLDSFINEDAETAKNITKMDDEVDELYERVYLELLEILSNNKETMPQIINLLLIGRYIERIADHTTNICEGIVYMTTGHRLEF
ncbi:phosphate signaling complex protein PhoU [Sporosalibacterium faouarense]|uniref:phosphate signaling complex protein PhoU n=1 Tax=Sporosalibacterium faouarense TaxID=516123 RepID=UPI00141D22C2|nr:phosphate signaling complex protein PhoU [Sporosalibacterium faouarense]MTI49059.1 phosphate signaling complex protein PhoU [Bacillota bacterium]